MQTAPLTRPTGHPLIRGAWRYLVTGRPLFGQGDNATWLRDATVDYRGGPVEKLTRARWRRICRRHMALTVPAGLAVCNWRVALAYVLVVLVALVAVGARASVQWWLTRDIRRDVQVPTWTVVARILGVPVRARDAVRVELPPGFASGDHEELTVRIQLPVVALDEGTQRRITLAAGQRLGIADPCASWVIRGTSAHVDISPRSNAPRVLTFADVRHYWTDAPATRPFVGIGPKRVPVYADLDNDGPHIGISGGTGTGKSTLLRIILAKRAASGAGIVVCDYKVNSHPFLRRLATEHPDRVVYVVDEEPISEAILAVFGEFQRRRELLKTDASALDACRPIDLVIEELNSLAERLQKWWGHERRRLIQEAKDLDESTPYVPTVAPCVDALAALVQMGRELLIRVHFAAQRLDAAVLSPRNGGAIRESITNRFLAKYTKAAWNMLCAGVPYEAFPGGPRGIWTAVVNGEVTHFRVPNLSNDEAYALALAGPAPCGPVVGAGRWVPEAKAALVTLGEVWELHGWSSRDALVKAVQRAALESHGLRGNAKLYDARELLALSRERPELRK